MKQIIQNGLVVLTIFYLGYFTALSTASAAINTKHPEVTGTVAIKQVKKITPDLTEVKGINLFPPPDLMRKIKN